RDSECLSALLEMEGINVTMFTDWFALKELHPPARARMYAEIPQYYVWYERSKMWKPRKQSKCIGSIVYSTPTLGERYFLRMFLNVVRGPRNFKEMLTTRAIQEASVWALGPQLHDLFVTILLFYDVSRPLKLWEETWEVLSEDILRLKCKLFKYPELQLTAKQIQDYCLVEIQDVLNRNGRSLAKFQDLSWPNPKLVTNMDNRLIREALDFDMNISNYNPRIVSLLLPAGRIAHSRFVIPLELLENSTCGIKQNTHLAELIQEVELIIWDEAPMTQKYAFKALDNTLRDILGYPTPANRNKIFGGLTVLLGGDFRQILLVIPKGKRSDIVHACINRSKLWKHCKVLAVGDGKLPSKMKDGEDEPTWIQILEKFLINALNSPIAQIVAKTNPNFIERHKEDAYLRERAILTPRNDDANAINAYILDKLEGESILYNLQQCRRDMQSIN
ncbi:ATP-dependent DNA helicase PIF1-like protein, partial [Tanacetum coccineum]